jgi:hypothetical protein
MPALLAIGDGRLSLRGGWREKAAARRSESAILSIENRPSPTEDAVWLPALARRPRWVIAGTLLAVAVLAVFACRVGYDHNLLNLQARGLDSVAWEMKLIKHTAGASWHALSYTATPEAARALRDRYEQLPGVSRVVEVASLVPPDQGAKLEQLRDIQRRLRALPARGAVLAPLSPTRAGPFADNLDHFIAKLTPFAGSSSPLPGGPRSPAESSNSLFLGLRRDLEALRDQLVKLPAGLADQRLLAFEQRLAGDLAEDLHRLRDVSSPAPIDPVDLPPALRERYISDGGKWLLRAFAAECLWEHDALAHFVHEVHQVDPQATGKPFLTLEGLRAMKSGFQWASIYALAAISTVLLLDFRSLRRTLWALAPLALG